MAGEYSTMKENKIIFITGAARSGTSLTAGVIKLSGAWMGSTSGPTIYNKKGMFENGDIRERCIKPLFNKLGVDPLAQNPLPNVNLFKEIDPIQWRDRILDILKDQGLEENQTWAYKGAKMCLMWPLFHAAFPKAKWIIVRRRKEEIINSCLRTGFMRGFNTREGWSGWVDEHITRFNEMLNADLDLREVWPQEMIDGGFKEIKSVIEWLGLDWDQEKTIDFVEPKYWNEGKIIINDKEVGVNG
jgi:hypothetical protein